MLRTVAVAGRVLIAGGVVILLFVAYQLWGTQFLEARSQRDLRASFEHQASALAEIGPDTEGQAPSAPAATGGERRPDAAAAPAAPLPPVPGDALAILRIPKLGLDKVVVEGTDEAALRKGPGHEPGTALPGQAGNAVIAGHRTTYGAPFYRLDELAAGDTILVRTLDGEARYTVTGSQVVQPSDVWILDPTPDDRLTLFTCTPRFSAAQRLVVSARLDAPSSTATPPAPPPPGVPEVRASPPHVAPAPEGVGQLAEASGSFPAAGAWAVATLLAAAAVWWAGRRFRRLIAYPVGAPVVGVLLFVTFERVAALLPAAV